jgi:hypothetical protein
MPCPSHPLYLIILIIFGEEYKLWNSSIRSFLQLSIISSLCGRNIILRTNIECIWFQVPMSLTLKSTVFAKQSSRSRPTRQFSLCVVRK